MTDSTRIVVYPARRIVTMNRALPTADAVAVRGDQIVEVGTLESMQPWLDAHPHSIDDRFRDAVLTPGFIDPHLHPAMAAVLLPMEFITAMEWKLPWGRVTPTLTADAFDTRLMELHRGHAAGEPLLVWGYHQLWHGAMARQRINAIDPVRPIVVWHRSFHELYLNDAALDWLEITEAEAGNRKHIDLAKGHFFETGLGYAINRLNPHILAPSRFRGGLHRLRAVAHAGGHTTIGDMAVGIFDFDLEWSSFLECLNDEQTPFRTELIASGLAALGAKQSNEAALEFIRALPERNTDRLRFSDHVKLFADGAMFSQLAQMQPPGYIDGHHGEWLSPPDLLEEQVRLYWNAGFKIHVHCCGDLAVELTLDILEKMQWERPRFNHGFTIEHFGFSTSEQVQRIARLGANVSANVYYLHELSAIYARQGIGFERASQIARLKSCFDAGVTTALHSDFTMAPAEPLNSAWVAVNRINAEGEVMAEPECLTPYEALAAITINAAWVLGRESDVGSIRAGKKADFAILEADPLEVPPEQLKDIRILGTMFEGTHYPTQPAES